MPTSDVLLLYEMPIRQDDKRELEAATGLVPHVALVKAALGSTHTYVAQVDNDIVAVAGFKILDRIAIPWLIATDEFFKYRFTLTKKVIGFIDNLKPQVRLFVNAVDARNTGHIKWLEWLGFKFDGTFMERNGYKFLQFTMRGELNV